MKNEPKRGGVEGFAFGFRGAIGVGGQFHPLFFHAFAFGLKEAEFGDIAITLTAETAFVERQIARGFGAVENEIVAVVPEKAEGTPVPGAGFSPEAVPDNVVERRTLEPIRGRSESRNPKTSLTVAHKS